MNSNKNCNPLDGFVSLKDKERIAELENWQSMAVKVFKKISSVPPNAKTLEGFDEYKIHCRISRLLAMARGEEPNDPKVIELEKWQQEYWQKRDKDFYLINGVSEYIDTSLHRPSGAQLSWLEMEKDENMENKK